MLTRKIPTVFSSGASLSSGARHNWGGERVCAQARYLRLDAGAWAPLARHGDAEIILAPSGDGACVRYDVGRDGRWISTVSCAGSFRDAFDRPVCPRRIDVAGHQAGVWASAEVFAWKPSNAEELEFEQAFGGR